MIRARFRGLASDRRPLGQALVDDNTAHANIVVYEADYKALKRVIEYLPPPMQQFWTCRNARQVIRGRQSPHARTFEAPHPTLGSGEISAGGCLGNDHGRRLDLGKDNGHGQG